MDPVCGLWHHVGVGCIAEVSDILIVTILKAKALRLLETSGILIRSAMVQKQDPNFHQPTLVLLAANKEGTAA
jgi:hypothetical protein